MPWEEGRRKTRDGGVPWNKGRRNVSWDEGKKEKGDVPWEEGRRRGSDVSQDRGRGHWEMIHWFEDHLPLGLLLERRGGQGSN